MRVHARCFAVVLAACAFLAGSADAQTGSFHAFESGPVRPLALSPDGLSLFAVNTPDNRLEIFSVTATGLRHRDSVPVGMEPVAVAARSNSEVWVVNHLSDSVSVVDVAGATPRVLRTLLVGDEPRDIVFAGTGGNRAFITTAHRGQHRTHSSIAAVPGAGDPGLITAGRPRADVWVFDAANLGATIGGTPLRIVQLFGDTPRALAVSPNGNTVYAAIFHSGNQTAVVSEGRVCDGFGTSQCAGDGVTSPNGLPGGNLPGGLPGPSANVQTITAPEAGLVVKYDNASGQWRDAFTPTPRNWSNGIRFFLPDHDVFAIDANNLAAAPVDFEHVGTILFNMAVNPVNGNIYVSNTDSQNLTRFEGPGVVGGSTVQGNLAHSQITVIVPGTGAVKPRHLNRHIDYAARPAPAGTKQHSLATPLDMKVSSNGAKLYVAAFGSGKVGVFDTADLENDALWDNAGPEFDPTTESANYITVSGGGPSGLVLDETHNRLYVATRFNDGISIVDLSDGHQLTNLPLHNPEPASIAQGRFMLYDAMHTSSNGEASCSSCHVFGDFDSIAWDLGNPDDLVSNNPIPINLVIAAGDQNGGAANNEFHPMKGPMTTQTLRGMVNSGHMHWRGDRADGFFGIDSPNTNDSDLSFRNFIVAFPGLVGMDIDLSGGPGSQPAFEADVQKFADFMLQVLQPPNPVRAINNSLTTAQQNGRNFYFGPRCADGTCLVPNFGFTCNGCHALDASQGFFGTGGIASFENEKQIFKIPHLRNMYQKVGMFGMPHVPFNNPNPTNAHQGDQVRGTGYLHDGSTDTLFRFLQATVFNNNNTLQAGFNGGDPQRRDVEQFLLAFDSDLAPAVGQQVTLPASANADTLGRVADLEARAEAPFVSKVLGGNVNECDLVVKGVVGGVERSYLYDRVTDSYLPDSASQAPVSPATLRTYPATSGQELTFTCAPPGAGVRMALDRDEDGFLDFDELQDLTDAANPASFDGACADGLDNDGDGLNDLADPGCLNATWDIENPACNDGIDNDADGTIDTADALCTTAAGMSEEPAGCGLLGIEALFALAALGWRRSRR